MNKKLMILIIVAAVFVAGCLAGGDVSQGSEDPYTARIQCLFRSDVGGPYVYIFRDTETGYEYMFVSGSYNGGIVRLDEKE